MVKVYRNDGFKLNYTSKTLAGQDPTDLREKHT